MEKKPYLREDEDIIAQLKSIQPATPHEKIGEIEIQALLRTRKTYQESGKIQEKFNWVILTFTMIQVLIALVAITYQIFPVRDIVANIGIFILLIVAVIVVFKEGLRQIDISKGTKDKD